jgi:hypothetical protein
MVRVSREEIERELSQVRAWWILRTLCVLVAAVVTFALAFGLYAYASSLSRSAQRYDCWTVFALVDPPTVPQNLRWEVPEWALKRRVFITTDRSALNPPSPYENIDDYDQPAFNERPNAKAQIAVDKTDALNYGGAVGPAVGNEYPFIWRPDRCEARSWYIPPKNGGVLGFLILIGLALGFSRFFGERLFLLLFALFRHPWQTVQSIPDVWASRLFEHSILSWPELLPGYPLKLDDGRLPVPDRIRNGYWLVIEWAFAAALFAACVSARAVSKLAAPVLFVMVYLVRPFSGERYDLQDNAIRYANSGIIPLLAFAAATTLAALLLKLTAYVNVCEVEVWAKTNGLPQALDLLTPRYVTLWQIASVLAAMLFFAYLSEAELVRFRVDYDREPLPDWRLRLSAFSKRVRTIASTYSIICMVVILVPLFRQHALWVTDLKLALPTYAQLACRYPSP